MIRSGSAIPSIDPGVIDLVPLMLSMASVDVGTEEYSVPFSLVGSENLNLAPGVHSYTYDWNGSGADDPIQEALPGQ